jgi:hypothetical protein
MTVNDSINAVYEVRFEGDPQRKAGFEDRESAIEFAEEHKSEKPTVWLINVEVDGEGYGGEETGECAVWSWDEGDLDFERDDPSAGWREAAAKRKPLAWDKDEIMGISDYEGECGDEGCECGDDPFDCFGGDEAGERRFADREGRDEGTPLRALDPEELIAQLAAELGVKCDIVDDGEDVDWPKPESEGGEAEKTEVVVKAEVPEGVADGLKDGDVDVTVSKEGEIPEVSAEKAEIPEISDEGEKDGEDDKPKKNSGKKGEKEKKTSEDGDKKDKKKDIKKTLKESTVEDVLREFEAALGSVFGEGLEEDFDDDAACGRKDLASDYGIKTEDGLGESLTESEQDDVDAALADFEASLGEALEDESKSDGKPNEDIDADDVDPFDAF